MIEKVRSNTDYSASAVNLCNPTAVEEYLHAQRERIHKLEILQEKIDACVPTELTEEFRNLQKEIADEDKGIRTYIDSFGSYQNLGTGMYGVKQRVVSVNYSPDAVHKVIPPQLAVAVIVESVDKATVEALVKAGRISLEQQKQISSESVHFRYIIK
jgi:hypothetical protein